MRSPFATPAILAGMLFTATAASADPQVINLGTADGVAAVKGEWRYIDVNLVEVDGKAADGSPNRTYSIEPRAQAADYDDSAWEVLDPTTLGKARGAGQICFAWYRIKITLPDSVAGKKVTFQTRVDDYGEVWVDGKMPYKVGQMGGNIVAGFNALNIVELPDPAPGKTYSIAIFGINGPISVVPANRIFLRDTQLNIGE